MPKGLWTVALWDKDQILLLFRVVIRFRNFLAFYGTSSVNHHKVSYKNTARLVSFLVLKVFLKEKDLNLHIFMCCIHICTIRPVSFVRWEVFLLNFTLCHSCHFVSFNSLSRKNIVITKFNLIITKPMEIFNLDSKPFHDSLCHSFWLKRI